MRQVKEDNAETDQLEADKKAMDQLEAQKKAKLMAFEMFFGLLIDGVPEGILMGIMAAEGHLTPVLVISLLIANFPEAFASSSLLLEAEMTVPKIVAMWS